MLNLARQIRPAERIDHPDGHLGSGRFPPIRVAEGGVIREDGLAAPL
jgi:hypothetical protein